MRMTKTRPTASDAKSTWARELPRAPKPTPIQRTKSGWLRTRTRRQQQRAGLQMGMGVGMGMGMGMVMTMAKTLERRRWLRPRQRPGGEAVWTFERFNI